MLFKIQSSIALVLVIVGAALTLAGIRLLIIRNTPVNFSETTVGASTPTTNLTATNIKIPSLNVDLPIIEANITDGKWDNPDNKVAHWNLTPLPGDAGNSVMYGHNWPVVLEKLKSIKNEAEIIINFSDGTSKTFKVANFYIVTKDQIHILEPTQDTRITLYTCTGFLDSKRFVVTAVPTDSALPTEPAEQPK